MLICVPDALHFHEVPRTDKFIHCKGECRMGITLGEGLQLVAGILIVILAAYYATYFIAHRKSKRIPGKGINVHERFALSKDKMVCVIEVNGKAYLVAMTNGGATLLDTFDISEYKEAGERADDDSHAQPGYVPNGIIARGIWKLFNFIKSATYAKTANNPARRDGRLYTDVYTNSPEQENEMRDVEPDFTIRVAREEDGLDEIQRRLKNRMATQPEPDEEPEDE